MTIDPLDVDQSELHTNTYNRRQAREERCGRIKIGFGFASHRLRKNGASFTNQSQGKSKEKHHKSETDLFNQLKTPYCICKYMYNFIASS